MATYVEAGHAVSHTDLSDVVGKAPAVTKNLGYERILNAREAEPHNWITYYGGYDGQRYSLLDQINVDNVKSLTPAWVFQAGTVGMQSGAGTYSMEASPIVVDGVMFLTGYDGWVWALDAATGQELWRYKHASPYDISLCCGNVNRGCAVAEGKVFVTTLNAHVIALDAETGKIVWDKVYGDVRAGESATVAPLVVKDMVIVGSSGGEFGVRGHADAFKLETGEHVWRCYMVPKPGEPGSETWPADGEAWQRGGGNCWITPTYDADLNRLYFNTGNPCPDFDGGVREGDNLFTDSVVAVDPDTGRSWTTTSTPRTTCGTTTRRWRTSCSTSTGRSCRRTSTRTGICSSSIAPIARWSGSCPFVDRITWGEIDANGKVTAKVYPDKEGDPVHFWPGPAGAKEWTHAAYSPQTELLYAPVQDIGATATRRRREFKESIPYWGAGVAVDGEDVAGSISAFDPRTGEETWRWRHDYPMCASVLATAGDLVFAGEPSGRFNALNAKTGEWLWQFQCGSGHHSSPSTYSVDGRQYVVVPTGWGGWVEGFLPAMLGARAGSAVFAFALPE